MELLLEVISYKDMPAQGRIFARFTEQGGTIGRSSENQLALPDEEKVISRHHANIYFDAGVFMLRDVSTGGTWLYREERLLNQDMAVLSNGDRFKIGDYELVARIESQAQGEFADFFNPPAAAEFVKSPSADDFFTDLPVGFDPSQIPEPLGPLTSNSSPSSFPSFIEQADVSAFSEHFTPPDAQRAKTVSEPGGDFSIDKFFSDDSEGKSPWVSQASASPPPSASASQDFDLDQLFEGFEPVTPSQASSAQPLAQGHSEQSPPASFDDFFGVQQPDPKVEGAKLASSQNQVSVSPKTATPKVSPEVRKPSPSVQRPVEAKPHPIPQPGNREAVQVRPTAALNIPKPGRPQPQQTPLNQPESPVSRRVNPPQQQPPTARPQAIPQTQRPEPAPRAAPAPVQPAPTASVEGTELFKCFLEGAGLANFATLTPDEQKKAMKAVGLAYREMVDGMMQILSARKMEKSMIALRQADVTMVQPRENNPLKVFPTVEETMREMICQNNPAYIGPAQAVKEGFSDIMKHQIAMRAGMQAAMDGFLKRIEPKLIEQKFNEGIVFQKKAKCWDAFCQAYPRLVNETMDDLFGDAFAEAYREQLKLFRNGK